MGKQAENNRKRFKTLSLGMDGSAGVRQKPKSDARQTELLQGFSWRSHGFFLLFPLGLLVATFTWAYLQTLLEMEFQWRTEPDYSHGYVILPLALALLWTKRETFPGFRKKVSWNGLVLLVFAGMLRICARVGFMKFLDGWSIVLWVAGVVWMLAGRRALFWSMPAILLLLLLVPLPYRLESFMSWKLQSIVTGLSENGLRCLGLPAIAEGNTIWVGDVQMLVEEACSGMRIFVGMAAFAFFWASIVKRAWIDRWVILAAALPMAILANTLRVVVTCCSFYFLDRSMANRVHDWAGILMIFVAFGLLWCVKRYWELLYRPAQKFHYRHPSAEDASLSQ